MTLHMHFVIKYQRESTYLCRCHSRPNYSRQCIATGRRIERRSDPPVICNNPQRPGCRDQDNNGWIHSQHAAGVGPDIPG